ncbi:MAG TPA: carboxypeptidase regulatory-like domain-containing protein [Candidatus Baltobacteraceae bacterium]|nr:carboxypeptidase regulatory-like domain-containing protein [Candidatus Baltobacteraceae bacterium]
MRKQGFTLIELLITTTIIGLLSVAGMTSYTLVRGKARDAKRVSDIRTIYNAVELYFEQHGSYPPAPSGGLVLGSEEAKVISDAGITPHGGQHGALYLQEVPFNALPHGLPYLYRSKHRNGSLCESDCESYEVAFELEYPTGTLAAGPHLLTDAGVMGEEAGTSGTSTFAQLRDYLPSSEEVAAAFGTAQETAELARQVADREGVQTANKAVVAPAAIIGSIAGFAAALAGAIPFANAGQFFLLLVAQPYLYLTRRKRQGWGTVYQAGTKVPIDLATVRLVEAGTNRPIATKVTDKDGRFAFTPPVGTYRLEALKPGFAFPAASLAGVTDDGTFTDIYHGNLIQVTEGGKTLTVNVPMDRSLEPETEIRVLLSERNKKAIRKAVAAAGPFLGLIALIVTPSVPMALLFLVQIFLYQLFKRLAEPAAPRSQGTVYDIDTRKPLKGAVVRILSLPYHKVLESKLTDSEGRYSFNVGPGEYYLISLKPGYGKTETDPIDFTKIDKPAWVASDLPMQKAKEIKPSG